MHLSEIKSIYHANRNTRIFTWKLKQAKCAHLWKSSHPRHEPLLLLSPILSLAINTGLNLTDSQPVRNVESFKFFLELLKKE